MNKLQIAVLNNRMDVVRKIITEFLHPKTLVFTKFNDGSTALHVAARNGNIDVVKELINCVGDEATKLIFMQDNNGQTALHRAAWRGKSDVVEELLDCVGDEAVKLIFMQAALGWSALDEAVWCGNESCARELLKRCPGDDRLVGILNNITEKPGESQEIASRLPRDTRGKMKNMIEGFYNNRHAHVKAAK